MSIVVECSHGGNARNYSTAIGATLRMLAVHATPPHFTHRQWVKVDGVKIEEMKGPVTMEISCRACDGAQEIYRVTPELLAVAALHFHCRHEGHALEIIIDGQALL